MQPISLKSLTKTFGATVAVDDVTLRVPAGSLFFLLGPSGCGKTTLLRMIAGFTTPTSGKIHFGDRDVTSLAANKRNCGMVFQSYALWPHMTVRQNVEFGLNVRRVPAEQRRQRAEAALKRVQMFEYADRKPNQLSGGQQQRVAVARALVIEPTVLLLDEPLSNLDAKLRLEMRGQIRQICKDAAITAVYVTHDQKEALSMADHVAVLNRGKVVQVGPPREIYDKPVNRFVADFLGETNFIDAEIVGREGEKVVLESPAGRLLSTAYPHDLPNTGNVTLSIRPEALHLAGNGSSARPHANTIAARAHDVTYLGEMAQHHVIVSEDLPALKIFQLNPRQAVDRGQDVSVSCDPQDVVILQD